MDRVHAFRVKQIMGRSGCQVSAGETFCCLKKSYFQNRVGFKGTILEAMCWEPTYEVRFESKHSFPLADVHSLAPRFSALVPSVSPLSSAGKREHTGAPT
jgi:hypothetical protein